MADYIRNLRKLVGHIPLMQVGASVILVNELGEILLQKRADNGCWGYHGGSVDLDESVETAAVRELFEETGLTAISLELFGVFSGNGMNYVYPNGDIVSNVDKLAFEVISTIVAIKNSFLAGKPLFTLPNMTFTCCRMNDSSPPVITDEKH
jgi:8-oxo-dGTP pyrophosphatase MutT (NUDIX family)